MAGLFGESYELVAYYIFSACKMARYYQSELQIRLLYVHRLYRRDRSIFWSPHRISHQSSKERRRSRAQNSLQMVPCSEEEVDFEERNVRARTAKLLLSVQMVRSKIDTSQHWTGLMSHQALMGEFLHFQNQPIKKKILPFGILVGIHFLTIQESSQSFESFGIQVGIQLNIPQDSVDSKTFQARSLQALRASKL